MRLSYTFTLTGLPIYEWILFQKQELFNAECSEICISENNPYIHIYQLLIRPPDGFVFVLRQAVPPASASYCWDCRDKLL